MSKVKVEHECHKCNEWITTEHTDNNDIDDYIIIVTTYDDSFSKTIKEGILESTRKIKRKYFHLSCASDSIIKKYEKESGLVVKGHIFCRAMYEI